MVVKDAKGTGTMIFCWVESSNQLTSLVLLAFKVSLKPVEVACLVPHERKVQMCIHYSVALQGLESQHFLSSMVAWIVEDCSFPCVFFQDMCLATAVIA